MASLDKYEEGELDFIQERLALKMPIHQLITEFKQAYDGRPLTYDIIYRIKNLFKEDIKQRAIKELNNPTAVPIAYSRIRLGVIQTALEIACQMKGRGSYPITGDNGLTQYKEKIDIDHQAAAKWVDLAQKEEFLAKKLIFEKLARGITQRMPEIDNPGIPSVALYTGCEDDDTRLLIDAEDTVES